jgi:hypothetical protein
MTTVGIINLKAINDYLQIIAFNLFVDYPQHRERRKELGSRYLIYFVRKLIFSNIKINWQL